MAAASKRKQVIVRLITAAVVVPILLLLIWLPQRPWQWGFSLFISALCGVGLFEYYAILRARAISPETIGGIIAGVAVVFSGHFGDPIITNLVLYGGCLMVAALHIVRGMHSVAGLTSTVFGVFYVGWFASHVILLRGVPVIGRGAVTMLVLAVSLSDTGAYFFGSAFGKHKLAPKVSPGKTWEGAIAGLLTAVAGGIALCAVQHHWQVASLPEWDMWKYAETAAILSIVSQIGDLTESVLKRDAGVKDSGAFFPGHGGVLDRADGLLFAAPVLYYIVIPLFTGVDADAFAAML